MPDFPSVRIGIYCHNKSGRLYELVGTALQTETNEPLVIYKPLYETEYELFARPYDMFTELVDVNGKTVPRFERVADDAQKGVN